MQVRWCARGLLALVVAASAVGRGDPPRWPTAIRRATSCCSRTRSSRTRPPSAAAKGELLGAVAASRRRGTRSGRRDPGDPGPGRRSGAVRKAAAVRPLPRLRAPVRRLPGRARRGDAPGVRHRRRRQADRTAEVHATGDREAAGALARVAGAAHHRSQRPHRRGRTAVGRSPARPGTRFRGRSRRSRRRCRPTTGSVGLVGASSSTTLARRRARAGRAGRHRHHRPRHPPAKPGHRRDPRYLAAEGVILRRCAGSGLPGGWR